MDLLEQTKNLCKLHQIIPARSKGQNFLIREEAYDEMVAAADLKIDDIVLEVGPGLGFLTFKLAARVKKVIAVELDDKLAEVLEIGLAARKIENVEVVNGDILKFPISKFKVVANLPYNITSIFLRKFLEAEIKPDLMALMLQKEVAERITASPREIPAISRGAKRISRGKPGKMSLLSVSVKFYAQAEIIKLVPKEFFWPEPKVDSAIIKIIPHKTPLLPPLSGGIEREKNFFQLVKFGFSARRKMLKNNLAAGFKIDQADAENKIIQAGFNGKIRAQELSVDDWLKLLSVFK
ncbi:MAG: rRNA adenine dimethyltransferase family protein [bacterium]|nr:rRNA adenine dimethyltransferase family protein [bacterium]